jgi:hypothetical protein
MGSGIAGLRGTGSFDAAAPTGTNVAERPTNFREMILWRDPNGMAPLTALMSKMKTESTDDPQFNWYEEELAPTRLQLNGAVAANTSSTTFTVYTTGSFTALDVRAGDLFMIETTTSTSAPFELINVTVDPTASNLFTATRQFGGSALVTAATAGYVTKVGTTFAEGSSAPTATSRTPTRYSNYTQIFKTAYNLTNTAKATKLRTGDPLKNEKKRRMFDHSASLEMAWLFGFKTETNGTSYGSTQPQRTTGGLFYWLVTGTGTSYVSTLNSATATQEDFLDATYQMFDYGYTGAGNERIVLCGNGFLNRLNKIVLSDSATQINYDGSINSFGMNLMKWVIPQGTFYLRTHPLMNVNTKFTNAAFFINPATMVYRPMSGRDTKFQDNIQNNDDDELKGQWLTEAGLEIHHLKTMKYIEFV